MDSQDKPSRAGDMEAAIGRIVAAYATRADVSPDDIVALFRRLTGEAQRPEDAPAQIAAPMVEGGLQPVLPLSRAVTEDKVYCLCCGRGFKMLKRHLGAEHGMTETEYRAAFGLSDEFPLVAPSYSRRKADHAKKAGLGKYDRSVTAGQD